MENCVKSLTMMMLALLIFIATGCTSYEDYRQALDERNAYIRRQSQP